MSELENSLYEEIRLYNLPLPEREWQFHITRKWAFDFCWPERKIALEVQGGLYVNGRHNRGAALEQEFDKVNEAQIAGWKVLLVGPSHCRIPRRGSSKALELLDRLLREA